MDAGGGAAALVGDVHAGGGDIDSLLSTDPEVGDKGRRLGEPYERHRAHDLRAECYRRGIRPIKKGPHANDNKGGYILLLRRYDGAPGGLRGMDALDGGQRHEDGGHDGDNDGTGDDGDDDDDGSGGSSASMGMSPHDVGASKKRKLLPPHLSAAALGMGQSLVGLGGGGASDLAAAAAAASNGDLQGFYEAAQPPGLVPVLPMQYTAPGMVASKSASAPGNAANVNANANANSATDLEILSGIANTYTQNAASDGQLCGNCRTVVTDQLMESIRLGRSRMQLEEWYRLAEQRDRDTRHLKDVLAVMGDLRKAFREAQADGINHDLLVELEDDLAFFQELKERTKERMRRAAQDAQARAAAKANVTA